MVDQPVNILKNNSWGEDLKLQDQWPPAENQGATTMGEPRLGTRAPTSWLAAPAGPPQGYQMPTAPSLSPIGPPPSLKIKLKEVDRFHGEIKGMHWRNYHRLFEDTAKWNHWTYSQKGHQLSMAMRGEARLVVDELATESQWDYNQLVAALKQRFDPEGQEVIYQTELMSRRRQSGETTMEYGHALSRLASKAYPTLAATHREPWVVRQFIEGLGSGDLCRYVGLKHPKTLTEAITYACDYEAFDNPQTEKRYRKPAKVSAVGTEEPSTHGELLQRIAQLEKELRGTLKPWSGTQEGERRLGGQRGLFPLWREGDT